MINYTNNMFIMLINVISASGVSKFGTINTKLNAKHFS